MTKKKKRARWIPGIRYIPLLCLQWIWHPFAVVIQRFQKNGGLCPPQHQDHDHHRRHRR